MIRFGVIGLGNIGKVHVGNFAAGKVRGGCLTAVCSNRPPSTELPNGACFFDDIEPLLVRSMATEWARHNIQINGIGPGYIATSQTEALRVDGHPFNDFIIQRTPAGRWGDAEDLAGTAVFLASTASDFVNGHIVYVDGGILATIGKPANED